MKKISSLIVRLSFEEVNKNKSNDNLQLFPAFPQWKLILVTMTINNLEKYNVAKVYIFNFLLKFSPQMNNFGKIWFLHSVLDTICLSH